MFLFIKHLTELTYSAPITETVMELRKTPLNTPHQVLRGQRLEVAPHATTYEHSDWLGNRVHQFSILPPHDRVLILARSAVETHPNHPTPDSVKDRVGAALVDHRMLDFARFTRLVCDCDALAELERALELSQRSTVGEIVERISQRLRDHLAYEKGITTSATAVAEVLEHKKGVCQDLAHVALALCRRLSLPARYVSGYYYKAQGSSELESHAWCEAFAPSVGWLAFDPTHRGVCGEGHVAVAVGRDFADVAPNRGVFRGSAEERLTVRVSIQEVSELPEGLLSAPATELPADVRVLMVPPRSHSEEIEYQQAQQQQQ